MKTDTYQSSKGPRLIADLPYGYLCNALRVIKGLDDPSRADEIESMEARRDELDRLFKEREAESVGVGA